MKFGSRIEMLAERWRS